MKKKRLTYEERLATLVEELGQRWAKLTKNGRFAPTLDNYLRTFHFAMLVEKYTEGWRRYHTFFHIKCMLDELDTVRDKIKNPEFVEFAIFLHDLIYRPGAKDNEAQSAAVAKGWLLFMGADKKTVRSVVRLISVATRHPKSTKARLSNDEKFMSDLDLYGFSLSWDTVLGSSMDVRREFSSYSDEEFRKGHAAFIMDLAHHRIYLTEHYHERYEKIARKNMKLLLKNIFQAVGAHLTDPRR